MEEPLTTYVYPRIGDLPVAEVATSHVLKIIEPIWKDKPRRQPRPRTDETILDAAKRADTERAKIRSWRAYRANLPARSRSRVGTTKAGLLCAPAFVGALRAREAVAALALEFTILTAARSGEVIGGTGDEVDLEKAVWTIPASR